MKWGKLKHIIILLLILFFMSFLYIKSNTIDSDKHNQLLEKSRQFNQVNAALNQSILEIRQGLLLHYDSVTFYMKKLSQIASDVEGILRQIFPNEHETIIKSIKPLNQTIKQKYSLLENFKTSNSLLQNSLRYLPTAVLEITKTLPSTKMGIALKQDLNLLVIDTLIYDIGNEKEIATTINNQLAKIQNQTTENLPNVLDDVNFLASHVKIILKNKAQLEPLTQSLITVNTTKNMNALLAAYNNDYARMLTIYNRYRNGLYGFSILLLIYIGYILFRLNKTVAHLQTTLIEREQIEVDLHASELRFRNMIDQSPFSIQVFSPKGYILKTNQAWETMWGSKLETLSDYNIFKDNKITKKGLMPYVKKGFSGEPTNIPPYNYKFLENPTKNIMPHERWIRAYIYPVLNKSGRIKEIIFMHEDVTKHVQREQKLLDSERQYRDLIESMHDLFQSVKADGNFLFVNRAWREALGYNSKEISKLTVWDIIHPDAILHCQKIFSKILSGEPVSDLYTIFISKTGKNIYVEGNITCKYEENKVIATHAVFRDVTSRRQAAKDKTRMESALRRSQKMDAIGQLSGGIAHDFNNQLGIIVGYLDFLKGSFSESDKALKWVNTATRATLRCMDLTRQLLSFSRRQGENKTVVNINASINEMETMIKRSVSPEVDVQHYLEKDLWLTEIDPGEFQDAILNLTINARDAMPNGGKLIIETTNKYLAADFIALTPEIKPGQYVQLMISDTGTGMSKEVLEHVFEPFFTTKSKEKGTGLGLAMVYGFVKRYSGNISIYSEPHLGTTIRIFLPRSIASENLKTVNANNRKTKLPTGTESILIVEDEIDLLHLASQYLNNLGYQTHLAKNALEALEVLSHHNDIDLLFSDVVMPGGINGFELAQQASKKYPLLKILITSGFTGKNIHDSELPSTVKQLLHKPYRKSDLALRIRSIFDKENTT